MSTLRIVFKVTGTGPFPFYLLAQDKCYPATDLDAEALTGRRPYSVEHVGTKVREVEGSRSVTLLHVDTASLGFAANTPSISRWMSLGWAVEILGAFCGGLDVTEQVREAARA